MTKEALIQKARDILLAHKIRRAYRKGGRVNALRLHRELTKAPLLETITFVDNLCADLRVKYQFKRN